VDLWFGQSIITMANVELLRGDREKAKKIINKDFADILKEIDRQMKEHESSMAQSPMAGARFLLGRSTRRMRSPS
jgi:ketopantoate reductase